MTLDLPFTLLPGTMANLEPSEGLEAWERLENKGGILRCLEGKFEPAKWWTMMCLNPFFDSFFGSPQTCPGLHLDKDIGAGLRLSHTQNIGNHMSKTHFS